MAEQESNLLSGISKYYSEKLLQYGDTSRGVDWNGPESQALRFVQLCKLLDRDGKYSLNDLGCGYGALLEHLQSTLSTNIDYRGYDIAESMISSAKARYPGSDVKFFVAAKPFLLADFGIASGIFNVRLELSDRNWFEYIENTLDSLNETSTLGFSFNCLTAYSDVEKMRDYLYYADPCKMFDMCKRKYSKNVALLHDYGLYEFTILVRKY